MSAKMIIMRICFLEVKVLRRTNLLPMRYETRMMSVMPRIRNSVYLDI
jgi:hypothetical protein